MIYKNCILLWRKTQKLFRMMAKVKGEKFDFKFFFFFENEFDFKLREKKSLGGGTVQVQ